MKRALLLAALVLGCGQSAAARDWCYDHPEAVAKVIVDDRTEGITDAMIDEWDDPPGGGNIEEGPVEGGAVDVYGRLAFDGPAAVRPALEEMKERAPNAYAKACGIAYDRR